MKHAVATASLKASRWVSRSRPPTPRNPAMNSVEHRRQNRKQGRQALPAGNRPADQPTDKRGRHLRGRQKKIIYTRG